MEEEKYFIFKTANDQNTFIGFFNPEVDENIHGIKFTGKIEGDVFHKGRDSNGNELIVIENPKKHIMGVKDFHENYSKFTHGIKLRITTDKFSNDVKALLSEKGIHPEPRRMDGEPAPAKKPAPSAKKKSAKKTSAKKKIC